MKIAIVIPAFNEENTIQKVVIESSDYGDVIVIDDGSSDSTPSILKKLGCTVITNKKNLGYDLSLKIGFLYCINQNYDYILTIDADNQHKSADLGKFIKYLNLNYDVVVGSRLKYQRFSEYIFSFFSSIFWNLNDPLCGLKGYNVKDAKNIIKNLGTDSCGTELAIRLIHKNQNFISLNIEINERKDSSRFGGSIFANLKIIISILKLIKIRLGF